MALALVGTSGEVHNGAERDRRQRRLADQAVDGNARSLELLLIELEPLLAAACHVLHRKQLSSAYSIEDLLQSAMEAVIRSLRKASVNPLALAVGNAKFGVHDFMFDNQQVYINKHDRRLFLKARNELQKSGRNFSLKDIAQTSGLELGNVVAIDNALGVIAHHDYADVSLHIQMLEEVDEEYEAVLPRLALLLPLERAYAERCLLATTPLAVVARELNLSRKGMDQVVRSTMKILRASFGDTHKDQLVVVEAQVRVGLVNLDECNLTDHQRFILREVVILQRSQGDVARELDIHSSSVSGSKTDAIRRISKERNNGPT